ncbi:MAG: transglutaminase domain-containing protein [Candidatus Krumholzibacteriota bacterium]|nr:transglutaminase domain-containing protein [Candidatus Krumholzibacteriota bacterium]
MRAATAAFLCCLLAAACGPPAELAELPPLADADGDGLPDAVERDRGTDPHRSDTDGDGLDDYLEIHKHGTDPLRADSDGDGLPDACWEERAEYAPAILAVLDLRPPFDLEAMNDFHQDARALEGLDGDVTRVAVRLYPAARHLLNPAPYAPDTSEATRPTYAKDWTEAMRRAARARADGAPTDLAALLAVLPMVREHRHLDLVADLGLDTDLPVHFHVHRDAAGAVRDAPFPASATHAKAEVLASVLFASGMFEGQTRGDCGSTSILRGALLRAAGLPERTILTIPLIYWYEGEDPRVELPEAWIRGWIALPDSGGVWIADHFFNEVRIGRRWVRVDGTIRNDVMMWGDRPGVKIAAVDDPTELDLRRFWRYETWREARPYRLVSAVWVDPVHARP